MEDEVAVSLERSLLDDDSLTSSVNESENTLRNSGAFPTVAESAINGTVISSQKYLLFPKYTVLEILNRVSFIISLRSLGAQILDTRRKRICNISATVTRI